MSRADAAQARAEKRDREEILKAGGTWLEDLAHNQRVIHEANHRIYREMSQESRSLPWPPKKGGRR